MKFLSTVAISSYSILLSFLAISSPAQAVSESDNNNSFATSRLLPSGVNSVDGQLENHLGLIV